MIAKQSHKSACDAVDRFGHGAHKIGQFSLQPKNVLFSVSYQDLKNPRRILISFASRQFLP